MAEFLCMALKGANKATLVGESTAGRGEEYGFYPLSSRMVLKLADSELLGINKRSWNGVGVSPDVMVQSASSFPSKSGQKVDVQLETAIQLGKKPFP